MSLPTISTKRRLIGSLFIVSIIVLALIARLGFIQIVNGQELKKQALEQWTRGIPIKAKRGVIYDRNGKKLAVSISRDTVWCRPADIDIENANEIAKTLSEILHIDEQEAYNKITSNSSIVKIKQWIEKEESDALRKANIRGIEIAEDNKRYYPFGSFAAYILGHTNVDQVGQYGVEKAFDKYLTGIPGKWVKTTDAVGRQLPYNSEALYEAKNGLNLVLTIDETIQHFAEKAALEAMITNKAKHVSIIIMEPNTGDVLAIATKPDYDPNDPRIPTDEELAKEWENLEQDELNKKWFDMWRNFPITDNYEPGSTFKIITAAAGLEENVVTPSSQFYCDGYVRQINTGSKPIKCWRYYNPHGSQTFAEGVQNSCNEVFVEVGLRLGAEKFYEYIKAFGFGETTNISLPGETSGIVTSPEYIKDVNLATISFGQGVAVTPIQLVTAISAIANGGNLMEPRIVKELIDEDGNVVHTYEPDVKRKVISEETSKTLLQILESVVSEGTGKNAYVPGYKVGGKTGTAQKVIDGRYADGKYIASFAAVAPADDPKIAMLVVIDEPSNGAYYGGQIAAPVAAQVIKETLNYLGVDPEFTEEEEKENENKTITVPDLMNKPITEASKTILGLGLKYNTDAYYVEIDAIVKDQFPLPGTVVKKGSNIDLYLESTRIEKDKVIVPDLTGKSPVEVTELLNSLNLRFEYTGTGIVSEQIPKAGTEVEFNSLIQVYFKNIE